MDEKTTIEVYPSTATLCERYDASPVTIWRWVKAGRLPKPQKINGQNRWLPSDKLIFDDEV